MERTPEPDLMDDDEQARAYAYADFAEPHDRFVALFRERLPSAAPRVLLDLGCGPGDVSRRLARAFPAARVIGLDGSRAMLEVGREQTRAAGLDDRIDLRHAYLPTDDLPTESPDAVVSNSLLHHLASPAVLWDTIRALARPGTAVFLMDLMRPTSATQARALVEQYAAEEPDVLRRDFENSLHAAYRPDEVAAQIDRAGLGWLRVEPVGDRHLIAHGMASAMEDA